MSKEDIKQKAMDLWDSIPLRDLINTAPVEKTLFLAYISICAPTIYFIAVAYGYIEQASNQNHAILNSTYTALFLLICVAHILILCHAIARGKRLLRLGASQVRADALWYLVAMSWVIFSLSTTYLVGTYYSDGMLLLLLGFTISLPLQRAKPLSIAFGSAFVFFILLTISDLSGVFPAGALFANIPYENGQPWAPWHAARLIMGFSTFILAFVASQTIAAWRRRELAFREASNTDGLTLLSNRTYFLECSNLAFQNANRRTDALACIMLDLDFFKRINDTYGHHAGDRVLIAVAKVLKQNAREYDEVCRLGGEEFAILMPATTIDVATQVASRIRKRLEDNLIEVDGQSVKITTSIGVACYPDIDIYGIEDLLKKADLALYEAKRRGRNKVVIAGETDYSKFKTA
ncbi:MAG: GGDEF domain-containing protein [Gammaproteobacteria bacterium]|nr:GGDEF domain-containing protein [Gammaproteobacteria bacterium]